MPATLYQLRSDDLRPTLSIFPRLKGLYIPEVTQTTRTPYKAIWATGVQLYDNYITKLAHNSANLRGIKMTPVPNAAESWREVSFAELCVI
jgi:hypothetical protein